MSSTDVRIPSRIEYCAFCSYQSSAKCCPWCRKDFMTWIVPLARNLSIAAGLCRAYSIGFSEGFYSSGEGFNGEYTSPSFKGERARAFFEYGGDGWRPGCGKAAP